MSEKTTRHYRQWRAHGLPASSALSYARWQDERDAVLGRLDAWDFCSTDYGAFASADLIAPELLPLTVRVLIGDDDIGTDWGDTEPTDEERKAAHSYYVAVQVRDAKDAEVFQDGIGGIDVIDLDGYLQRDWEDAAAFALLDYLLDDAEQFAAHENSERAHWAARDTITMETR